ncbi:MAG: hypothetical protein INF90_18850 [Roseomonas sp.]|nr:hypothetical protein [Roseomonas sp.]
MSARAPLSFKEFNPKLFEPATFVERGVNLPFTTPILLGARARPQEDGSGLEVIIANPSGADGVYILPWASIPQICTPTLHDRRLWQLLRDQTSLTPRSVQDAAETVALEGLAGRGPADAVQEARIAREARRKRINFGLLLNLIKRTEAPSASAPPPELDEPRKLMMRSQQAVARCAAQLRTTTETVAAALEELSHAFNGFGLPQDNQPAPARHLLAELSRTMQSVVGWREEFSDSTTSPVTTLILQSLELTLNCAVPAVEEFDILISDTMAALEAWQRDDEDVSQRLTRIDWLLDGWDTIIGIWDTSPIQEKANAIMEMAMLAPILPKEVSDWNGLDASGMRQRQSARIVQQFEDWRSGRLVDMIARNEELMFARRKSLIRRSTMRGKTTDVVPSKGPDRAVQNGAISSPSKPASGEKKTQLAETRHLMHALAAASDMALKNVVEILDRLPDRLEADRLLDAARPRLRQIRPLRSLQFTRLLFLPLDGAIADNADWKRDDTRLPRAALTGIAEALRNAMGKDAEVLEASMVGRTFQDTGAVDRAGDLLWKRAASLAPELKPGPRWASSGLRQDDFAPLVKLAASVWRHAPGLWAAIKLAGWGPPDEAVRTALTPLAAEGTTALAVGLTTLLQKATSPGLVAMAASSLSDQAGIIADAALDEWLANARVTLPGEDLVAAASLAETFGRAFQDLENAPPTRNPRRGERLIQLRQEAEITCRLAYEDGLAEEIFRKLPLLASAATPEQVTALEGQARALRRIELIGRRYGIDHGYDGAAKRIVQALNETKQHLTSLGLTKLDLARLGEILLGPEAALDLLA